PVLVSPPQATRESKIQDAGFRGQQPRRHDSILRGRNVQSASSATWEPTPEIICDYIAMSERCQQKTWTDRSGDDHKVFLYTRPSFMITLKFLAGSAIRLIFSSGLPSTSSRSASAPCSTTPSLPAYGLRFPDNASSSALVPVAMASASAGLYQRTSE